MTKFQEKADFIWGLADRLRGDYLRREYPDVILPMVVIRRLDLMPYLSLPNHDLLDIGDFVIMTLETSILDNLKKLPESMQQTVFLYTEFLVNRVSQQTETPLETKPETPSNKRGGLGIWKDKLWIADDFDAPLEDFQEYMS